ncbi:biotin--[acetyl-CoA-carboxylase] ligase [Sandarakinorhabdus sp.]|uniref:biotin--[acetyl-CoA-carboxylase] ligase n=1 Tax=Sandarakinorhabdus sp. TaxID=1916663 RepID=UPI0033428B50
MTAGITHLAEVGSTNDWLLARTAALPDGHWVIADRQTAGRGRRGRVWSDGSGNLMASVLVQAEGAVQQLSFVAALAVVEALAEITSRPPNASVQRLSRLGSAESDLSRKGRGDFSLKWPNDVLLGGVKCAGILLERQGAALVIGIGINLAQHPEATERPATSLAAAGLPVPRPLEALAVLAQRFADWRTVWQREGFALVRSAWLGHAAGIGGRMAARLGTETPEGVFTGLGDDGALLLRLDDGTMRAVHAGEVFAI